MSHPPARYGNPTGALGRGGVAGGERLREAARAGQGLRTAELLHWWPAVLLGAAGLLLIAAFDLGPPLAFNDDWGFAWSVRHLSLAHPHLYPGSSALALPQIAWGWLCSLGGGDPRPLRLSELGFVGLSMFALNRLARLAGADRRWAALAALAPLGLPVFTADATTFMSDVPYLGLLLAAALGLARWLQGRPGLWLGAVCAILATLERQVGVMIPLGLALALLIGGRRPARRDWPALAALGAGCLAAIFLPSLAGLAPPTQGNRLAAALAPHAGAALGALSHLPAMLGLGLLAFLPGLLGGSGRRLRAPSTILVAALLLAFVLAVPQPSPGIFPGNVFTALSLNWTTLPGAKPQIFWGPLYLGFELAALFTALVLLVRRPPPRAVRPAAGVTLLLVLLAATQFLPLLLLSYVPFDRYYLPVLAPLIPVVAAAVSRAPRPRLGQTLGLALVALGLGVYAVGEQDYQAWQQARDAAARLAYQTYSPYDVLAGYEAQAVYGEVPYYERTGRQLGSLARPGAHDFSVDGPERPLARLEFTRPDDPRPGVGYRSLAPGRIVIQPLPPQPAP